MDIDLSTKWELTFIPEILWYKFEFIEEPDEDYVQDVDDEGYDYDD